MLRLFRAAKPRTQVPSKLLPSFCRCAVHFPKSAARTGALGLCCSAVGCPKTKLFADIGSTNDVRAADLPALLWPTSTGKGYGHRHTCVVSWSEISLTTAAQTVPLYTLTRCRLIAGAPNPYGLIGTIQLTATGSPRSDFWALTT